MNSNKNFLIGAPTQDNGWQTPQKYKTTYTVHEGCLTPFVDKLPHFVRVEWTLKWYLKGICHLHVGSGLFLSIPFPKYIKSSKINCKIIKVYGRYWRKNMIYRVQLFRGLKEPYIIGHQLTKAEKMEGTWKYTIILTFASFLLYSISAYLGIGSEGLSK